jgi:NADP-dependent 3-hydroxy acid dehydrogenase YdfG
VSCLHPGNVLTERRDRSAAQVDQEPMIATSEIAKAALTMASLHPDVNMLEAIVLPVKQHYLGRG